MIKFFIVSIALAASCSDRANHSFFVENVPSTVKSVQAEACGKTFVANINGNKAFGNFQMRCDGAVKIVIKNPGSKDIVCGTGYMDSAESRKILAFRINISECRYTGEIS